MTKIQQYNTKINKTNKNNYSYIQIMLILNVRNKYKYYVPHINIVYIANF